MTAEPARKAYTLSELANLFARLADELSDDTTVVLEAHERVAIERLIAEHEQHGG
jgi:hypothetical protein